MDRVSESIRDAFLQRYRLIAYPAVERSESFVGHRHGAQPCQNEVARVNHHMVKFASATFDALCFASIYGFQQGSSAIA